MSTFLGLSREQLAVLALMASDAAYRPPAPGPLPLRESPEGDVSPEPFPEVLARSMAGAGGALGGIDAVAGEAGFPAWRALGKYADARTGLGAWIFVSTLATDAAGQPAGPGQGKHNLIVAFEGSNGPDPVDWYQNIDLARGVWAHAADPLFRYLFGEDLRAELGLTGATPAQVAAKLRVLFTGQSLGGGLAQYAAYDYVQRRLEVARYENATQLFTENTFSPDDVAVVTFNGFGAARGIGDVMAARDMPFDPFLLRRQGVLADHYAVANDIVHRVAGEHLVGVGGATLFDFRRFEGTRPLDGPRSYLDLFDSHRIEPGFYRSFRRYDADFAGAPTVAGQTGYRYLQTDQMQQVGAFLAQMLRQDARVSSSLEAAARIGVALLGVLLIGSAAQTRGVMDALAESQWRAGALSLPGRLAVNLLGYAKQFGGLAGAVAQASPLVWVPLLASTLCDLFRGDGVGVDRAAANRMLEQLDLTLADGSVSRVRIPETFRLDPALSEADRAHRLAVVLALAGSDSTLRELLTAPSSLLDGSGRRVLSGYGDLVESGRFAWSAQDVAELVIRISRGPDWRLAVVDHVGELARGKGLDAQQIVRVRAEVSSLIAGAARRIAPQSDYEQRVSVEQIDFLAAEAERIAALRDTYVADDASADPGVLGAAGSLGFAAFHELLEAFLADAQAALALADGTAAGAGLDQAHAQARAALERATTAGQTLAVTLPGALDPFDAPGFVPAPGSMPAVALGHGRTAGLMLRLPQVAGPGGQHIALTLDGDATGLVTVIQEGEVAKRAGERWIVRVDAGSDLAAIALKTLVPPAQDLRLTLRAQFVDWAGAGVHEWQTLGVLELAGLSYDPPAAGAGDDGAEFIRGTGRADHLSGDGGDDVIVGGADPDDDRHEWWERLVGFDILHGDHARDAFSTGGKDGNDRIYGDELVVDLAAYARETGVGGGSGQRGDWMRASRGRDLIVGGAGDDAMFGGWDEDVLVGGRGNDYLSGDDDFGMVIPQWSMAHYRIEAGASPFRPLVGATGLHARDDAAGGGAADILLGGGGDDTVVGLLGDDLVFGDDGDDVLAGDDGSDVLSGGDGDDRIAGDWGLPAGAREVLERPGGHDILWGGAGNDFAMGEWGNDFVAGGPGDDRLHGDSPDAELERLWGGDDVVHGDAGDDAITGGGGADTLSGGDGNDRIFGDIGGVADAFHGADNIDGGAGDDEIGGDGGDDILRGGDGNDVLHGDAGDDFIRGDADNDQLAGGDGDDLLLGGQGDDLIAGQLGDDRLDGGEGDDVLVGDDGEDVLLGGPGRDSLSGGRDQDVLDGGLGPDALDGGEGDDIYLLRLGESGGLERSDTIYNTAGADTVRFGPGVSASGLSVERHQDPDILALRYGAEDLVLIPDGHRGSIAWFEFDDGEVVSVADLVGAAEMHPVMILSYDAGETVIGGGGADWLTAAGGSAIISGGRGDDFIASSGRGDVLLFRRGDGRDTVVRTEAGPGAPEGGWSRILRMGPGITVDDVWLTGAGLTIQVGDDPRDSIVFEDFDALDPFSTPSLSALEFEDGSRMSYRELLERGTVSRGGAGADLLVGGLLVDRLIGLGGDDTLQGGAGNDELDAGPGNDEMDGGEGDDLYRLAPGDGRDTLSDLGGRNRILFGAGVDAGAVTARALPGMADQRHVVLGYGPGDELTVPIDNEVGQTLSWQVGFADGTVMTLPELLGRSHGGVIFHVTFEGMADVAGSPGNDTLWGADESDRLVGGDGADEVAGGAGADSLGGGAGNDTLVGGAGDDALDGGPGDDVYRFFGGWGHDRISDAGGQDALDFATLRLGALRVERLDDDLVLRRRDTGDSVAVERFFDSDFARPGAWQLNTAEGAHDLAAVWQEMLSAVTWLSPQQAIEDFRRRAQAAFGLALETSGYARGEDGVFRQRWVQDLDWLTRIHELSFEWAEVQQDMSGELAQRLVLPNPAPVALRTSTRSETRPRVVPAGVAFGIGRGGNVSWISSPIIIGNMTEAEYIADKNRPGKARGYPSGEAVQTYRNPATGDILLINRRVRILPSPSLPTVGTYQHETTTVDLHHVRNFAHLSAGDGDDLIVVGADWSADHPAMGLQFDMLALDAGAGDDVVRPLRYADYYPSPLHGPVSRQVAVPQASFPGGVLFGNEGDDALHGGAHDDRLIGGRGDDLLIGGLGNDEYVFFHGDGLDTVLEHGAVAPGRHVWNEIVLPVGVRPGDLVVDVSSVEMLAIYEDRPELVDTRLEFPFGHAARSAYAAADLSWGTADRVRVILPHREHNAGSGVNAIRFSDGTVLPFARVLAGLTPEQTHPQDLGNRLVAVDIGESLAGLGGDDTLQGGAGADELIGGPGRDVLLGGAGHDYLIGARLGVLRMEDRPDVLVSELPDEGNVYRGGPGHDTLWLTSGADVVEVGLGDGEDVLETLSHARFTYGGFTAPGTLAPGVAERAALLGNRDTLRFGPGVLPEAVRVDRVPVLSNGVFHGGWQSDLLLSYQGPWNSVRVVNWFDADLRKGNAADPGGAVFPHQLQRVEFADGTVWNFEDILDRVGRAAPGFQDNRPPRPLPGREISLAPGQLFDLDLDGLVFEDPDSGDELLLSAETQDGQPLPDWMWIDGHERRLHGFAPTSLPGGLALRVTALDKARLEVEGSLLVWVGERNRAPEPLAPVISAPAVEASGWHLDLHVHAFRDVDPGDVLAFGMDPATSLPAWMRFDVARGILDGTPGPEDVGESRVTITATDLAGQTASIVVRVPVAAAPGRRLIGDASDERLLGTGSADTLAGAAGRDVLQGFGGDDEYRWSPGDGLDRIVDSGGSDVLVFGAGVSANDVVLRHIDAASGALWGLRLRDGSGSEIRGQGLDISADRDGAMPIETLRFADGAVVDARALPATPQWSAVTTRGGLFRGSDGDDEVRVSVEDAVVFGGAGNDRVHALGGSLVARGGAGDDLLSGGAGDDILFGDAGVDVVSGGAGRDLLHADGEADLLLGGLGDDVLRTGTGLTGHVLVGGPGSDALHLGAGTHLLAWNPGDGMDVLHAGRDTRAVWSIGGGAGPSAFSLRRASGTLVLETAGGEGMRLEGWFDRATERPSVALQFVSPFPATGFSGNAPDTGLLDLAQVLTQRDGAEMPLEQSMPLLPEPMQGEIMRPVTGAVGGDLSWAYANGGMSGLEGASLHRLTQLLAFPGITSQPQPVHADGWLRDGAVTLARL